jgi:hypothetical protein
MDPSGAAVLDFRHHKSPARGLVFPAAPPKPPGLGRPGCRGRFGDGVPDGTYHNAFLAIQGGNGITGGFACATVAVTAVGEAASGTGCTYLG